MAHAHTDPTPPPALVESIRAARHIAVLTGAGMSAESGIPTFRDALTGLWSRIDPETLATRAGFERDPPLVWGWYEARRRGVMRSLPNAGHLALRELAALPGVRDVSIVTQNVDDLHERAGSASVIHLHGSLFAPRCLRCGKPASLAGSDSDAADLGGSAVAFDPQAPTHAVRAEAPLPDVADAPDADNAAGVAGVAGVADAADVANVAPVANVADGAVPPPRCPHCGGPIRPGVVWFGEDLPAQAWAQAVACVEAADLLLVVGTSGRVYPAASLPDIAERRGQAVWVIDPDEALAAGRRSVWRSTAALALPALVSACKTMPR
jgi:NAD-dependent deacetylase